MPEQYQLACRCGSQLLVELYEAGTSRSCETCGAEVVVPGTTKLKLLSGDPYPLLSPLQKIQATRKHRQAPFDGRCHGCRSEPAKWQIPVQLKVLIERHITDDRGIRPSLLHGVKLVVSEAEEHWETTSFPLLLCSHCRQDFEADRQWSRRKRLAGQAVLLSLLAAFLYLAWHFAEAVAAIVLLIEAIALVAWIGGNYRKRSVDPRMARWLSRIRWLPDVLAGEDEYKVTIGRAQPW